MPLTLDAALLDGALVAGAGTQPPCVEGTATRERPGTEGRQPNSAPCWLWTARRCAAPRTPTVSRSWCASTTSPTSWSSRKQRWPAGTRSLRSPSPFPPCRTWRTCWSPRSLLHRQRAHADFLSARGGHYLFTVKGNQPLLRRALMSLAWAQAPGSPAGRLRHHRRRTTHRSLAPDRDHRRTPCRLTDDVPAGRAPNSRLRRDPGHAGAADRRPCLSCCPRQHPRRDPLTYPQVRRRRATRDGMTRL
jgi:hypothetical protein